MEGEILENAISGWTVVSFVVLEPSSKSPYLN
jgi:hypothetical protein